jgi:hypothetical protein
MQSRRKAEIANPSRMTQPDLKDYDVLDRPTVSGALVSAAFRLTV